MAEDAKDDAETPGLGMETPGVDTETPGVGIETAGVDKEADDEATNAKPTNKEERKRTYQPGGNCP